VRGVVGVGSQHGSWYRRKGKIKSHLHKLLSDKRGRQKVAKKRYKMRTTASNVREEKRIRVHNATLNVRKVRIFAEKEMGKHDCATLRSTESLSETGVAHKNRSVGQDRNRRESWQTIIESWSACKSDKRGEDNLVR